MRILILTSVLLVSTAAHAADNGIYFGGGMLRSSINASGDNISQVLTNANLDDDDTGFKVIAGIRPLDWLAAEVNYVDFGEISVGNSISGASYSLKGVDAFAVGLFELPFVDIYGKLGLITWDSASKSNVSAYNTASFDDSGTDLAYGAGVQVRMGSIAARLEYERFEVANTDEAAAVTLGLTWTFL